MLAVPNVAHADAIATSGNDFFDQHANDIIFLGWNFIADGEAGSVAVKESPGSAKELYKIENGDIVFVQYSCLFNGKYWGYIYPDSGWAKLDQMLLVYDNRTFSEDHRAEFYIYEGTYTALENAGGAIAWSWPGSGIQLGIIEGIDSSDIKDAHTWKDPEGREWVLVYKYQGFSVIWICLSDPMNGDIPAFNPASLPSVWVPETEYVDIGKSDKNMVLPIVILVAAVVVVTILLIKIIWKKRRN